MMFSKIDVKYFITLIAVSLISISNSAYATVSFVSADNNVTLDSTEQNDDGGNVFIFKGLADGDSSTLTFTSDTDCPYIAITGGAKFNSAWSCTAGSITMSVTYKGGLSFGPATDANADSFYITFGTPPTPAGMDSPPEAFRGIQFSLYGDISSWSVTGGQTTSGISFGIELTGSQGGDEYLQMDLPAAAAAYLGSVLGMTVDGKPNPFAEITTNEDGSVSLVIDIKDLQKSNALRTKPSLSATSSVKKKFLAGERSLGIAAQKGSIKSGKNLKYAMCAGTSFTVGDSVTVSFTVGGKTKASLKSKKFTLDSKGCASKTVKIPSGLSGKLVAKIKYKGKTASSTSTIK